MVKPFEDYLLLSFMMIANSLASTLFSHKSDKAFIIIFSRFSFTRIPLLQSLKILTVSALSTTL